MNEFHFPIVKKKQTLNCAQSVCVGFATHKSSLNECD